MNIPTAYAHYQKKGNYIYRTSTYIQWGDSEQSIGACLLCNPGSAELGGELAAELHREGKAEGKIHRLDETMEQLVRIVEGIYEDRQTFSGRLYIYNLFIIQDLSQGRAIDLLEKLIIEQEYDPKDSLVSVQELRRHPWILLGWGVANERRWKNYGAIKQAWKILLHEATVPTFGKKHLRNEEYYHVCPRIPTQRPGIVQELIKLQKNIVDRGK